MVGLLYLKHIHKLSDKQLVHGWLENSCWQYFNTSWHLPWAAAGSRSDQR
ncbi:MAG: transposase [Gammaproteobacteria bacterium]|nr:transposase [Gammaproteobacteria bacterium]